MAKSAREKDDAKASEQGVVYRTWTYSLFWAAVIVGISIIASATINPLFNRYVHWGWMAGVAPTGFILLTLAFRRRWF